MRKRIIKIQCDKCIFSKVPLLSYWWSAPHQHAWSEALGGLSQLAALLCQVFEQCLDGRGVMWLVIVVRKCDNIVILIITHQVNPSTYCSSSLPKTISLKSPFPPLFFFHFYSEQFRFTENLRGRYRVLIYSLPLQKCTMPSLSTSLTRVVYLW